VTQLAESVQVLLLSEILLCKKRGCGKDSCSPNYKGWKERSTPPPKALKTNNQHSVKNFRTQECKPKAVNCAFCF